MSNPALNNLLVSNVLRNSGVGLPVPSFPYGNYGNYGNPLLVQSNVLGQNAALQGENATLVNEVNSVSLTNQGLMQSNTVL